MAGFAQTECKGLLLLLLLHMCCTAALDFGHDQGKLPMEYQNHHACRPWSLQQAATATAHSQVLHDLAMPEPHMLHLYMQDTIELLPFKQIRLLHVEVHMQRVWQV